MELKALQEQRYLLSLLIKKVSASVCCIQHFLFVCRFIKIWLYFFSQGSKPLCQDIPLLSQIFFLFYCSQVFCGKFIQKMFVVYTGNHLWLSKSACNFIKIGLRHCFVVADFWKSPEQLFYKTRYSFEGHLLDVYFLSRNLFRTRCFVRKKFVILNRLWLSESMRGNEIEHYDIAIEWQVNEVRIEVRWEGTKIKIMVSFRCERLIKGGPYLLGM